MARYNVSCREAHTPQSPNKNRIRRDWLENIHRNKDIITISHGALEAMMMFRWKGKILVCDIDPGVIEATHYMRETEYPDLHISLALKRIEDVLPLYCLTSKVKDLGAVDLDLAGTLVNCWPICSSVLSTLVDNRARGTKVLFTFRNGRDIFGKNAIYNRINWIKNNLIKGVKVCNWTTYNSANITKFAGRIKGSAMCMVELQIQ